MIKLLRDTKKLNIEILAPNINNSNPEFIATNYHTIEYGLAAIKNVGYKAAEQIAIYRSENGEYKNIFDLATINNQGINKKVIESLILVGACNSLGYHRSELYNSLDLIIEFSAKYSKNKNKNQVSLFGSNSKIQTQYPIIEPQDNWSTETELKHEKKLLGFYLTNNPLNKYEQDFQELSTIDINGKNKLFKSDIANIGGIITTLNLRYDKKGNQWAILTLDTLSGTIQIFVFHNTYLEFLDLLSEDNIIFIKGKISNASDANQITQIIANKIYSPDNLISRLVKNINIHLQYNNQNEELLNNLYKLLKQHSGNCSIILHLDTENQRIQKLLLSKYPITITNALLDLLRELFGNKNVWLT